jgi:ribosomal protein L27
MAHKKGAGSSRNGRDSNSQRLGVKDDNLFSVIDVFVKYETIVGGHKRVSVLPLPAAAQLAETAEK